MKIIVPNYRGKPNLRDLADLELNGGEIFYYDGTNIVVLSPGEAGQVLRMNSEATGPEWYSLPIGGGGASGVPRISRQIVAPTLYSSCHMYHFVHENGGHADWHSAHHLRASCQTSEDSEGKAAVQVRSCGIDDPRYEANCVWDANPVWVGDILFHLTASGNSNGLIGLGGNGDYDMGDAKEMGFAFTVENGEITILCHNCDGTSSTQTEVPSEYFHYGTSIYHWNRVSVEMTGGSNIKFYSNKNLVATHTTNLPSGALSANCIFTFYSAGTNGNTDDQVICIRDGSVSWDAR